MRWRWLPIAACGSSGSVQTTAWKPSLPFADVGVAPEEIHRAGAEAEQLRHPGVVVVSLGEMAIGAILRRPDAAGGVREMRVEGLAAVAFGGDGLRLRVDPFAVLVLRTDHDRAGGTDHGHAVLLHRAVDPEHEDVVAHHLRIVGGEVAIHHAFVFVQRHALVRLHRQMATEAARRPRGVADLAIHRAVVVREMDASARRRAISDSRPSSSPSRCSVFA